MFPPESPIVEDLFSAKLPEETPGADTAMPLAARMRPESLEEYAGQEHLLGPGKLLRRAIEADRITSLILYGPPGTGKTSLARVIANSTQSKFEVLSGVENGVADIRRAVASASFRWKNSGEKTILFLDEIHRLSKSQQDVLLPDVEQGTIRLIGATTHNPFFTINSPLVSRSLIFQLEPLARGDLKKLLQRALTDPVRGFGTWNLEVAEEALEHLAEVSDGDARKCLGALEIAVLTTPPSEDGVVRIGRPEAEESIQKKAVVYDADGDAHYDTISAFIKSMRGSDPDATLYWLAKMLHAGEDPRFIARRIIICASEDIGLADSQALPLALAAHQAAEILGMPEARIPLAHAAVHLATAPKSNRAYAGLNAALEDVAKGRTLPVPRALRDGSYHGAKSLGNSIGYQYSHDGEENFIPQAFLPEGRRYYEPTQNGQEKRISERLEYWRALFEESRRSSGQCQ